jgi:hypothetical protein
VRQKFGRGVVMASPSAEAIPTEWLLNGKGGAKLDGHDRITMAKNRITEWGQMVFPDQSDASVGVTVTGELPDMMHLLRRFREVGF